MSVIRLSKTEAAVLEKLAEERRIFTATELADAVGVKKSNFSKHLKKLASLRLASVSRAGREKKVACEYAAFSSFAQAKTNYAFLKMRDVLQGRTPFVLAFLHQTAEAGKPFRLKDLGLPAATAARMLNRLRGLGIVYTVSRGRYAVNARALPLAAYCMAFVQRTCMAEADGELQGLQAAIVSMKDADGVEAVFTTAQQNSARHYWPTAFSVFSEYGVKLVMAGRHYYSNVKPKLADAIVHALALGRDARTIAYVAAVMDKNKFNHGKLIKDAPRFGLTNEFLQQLATFVEAKGRTTFEGFPSWEEVEGVKNG